MFALWVATAGDECGRFRYSGGGPFCARQKSERQCVFVACLLGLAVENGISSLFGGALLIFWCSCDVLLCSAIDDNDASPPIELFQNSFSR